MYLNSKSGHDFLVARTQKCGVRQAFAKASGHCPFPKSNCVRRFRLSASAGRAAAVVNFAFPGLIAGGEVRERRRGAVSSARGTVYDGAIKPLQKSVNRLPRPPPWFAPSENTPPPLLTFMSRPPPFLNSLELPTPKFLLAYRNNTPRSERTPAPRQLQYALTTAAVR